MADTMSAQAQWRDGFRFDITTGTGHELTVDASAEVGGGDAGARPTELLLAANATCMGMDVISILRKMRQEVRSYTLKITGERADDHPRIFTHILIEHFIEGEVEEAKLAHAIELSEEKYCTVSAMLNKVARIETKYVIKS
ncbi:MAG: OsmC family protein [Armatimonadota bacterium]